MFSPLQKLSQWCDVSWPRELAFLPDMDSLSDPPGKELRLLITIALDQLIIWLSWAAWSVRADLCFDEFILTSAFQPNDSVHWTWWCFRVLGPSAYSCSSEWSSLRDRIISFSYLSSRLSVLSRTPHFRSASLITAVTHCNLLILFEIQNTIVYKEKKFIFNSCTLQVYALVSKYLKMKYISII